LGFRAYDNCPLSGVGVRRADRAV